MITYIATNTLNGKFYIGSTKDFGKRKKDHLKSKNNYPFQNALRKHPDLFEWETHVDDCDEPVLEQALLDMWFGKEQCYNINPFASRPPSPEGREISEEMREKIREKLIGRDINTATREAVSLSNKTRVLSEETLIKKSESMKGDKNPFYGKKHSETLKTEWSEKRKGKVWWCNTLTGETTMSREAPGPEWVRGRKPR